MLHGQNPEAVKIWGRRDIKATVNNKKITKLTLVHAGHIFLAFGAGTSGNRKIMLNKTEISRNSPTRYPMNKPAKTQSGGIRIPGKLKHS
jgi:hypothetical protein